MARTWADEDLNELVGMEGCDQVGGKLEGEGKRRERVTSFSWTLSHEYEVRIGSMNVIGFMELVKWKVNIGQPEIEKAVVRGESVPVKDEVERGGG